MVNWLRIEDVGDVPTRVWLSREKDTDPWEPLRKADCQTLNDNFEHKTPQLIEYGRATADPDFGVIRYNYYKQAERQLASATWFLRKEDPQDHKKFLLIPLEDEVQAIAVEELYQHAVQAASSLGSGLDTILDEQVPIDDKHHVAVQKAPGNHYLLRKVPNRWFGGKSYDLQRGYGAYTVPGEEDEAQLGPVADLIFVVHGIGEAMWSREDVTFTGSLIQDLTNYRLIMQKRQIDEWKADCAKAERAKIPLPSPPNRVELVPVLWYDSIHSSSSALMKSLQATTLRTIPALREIANDVIFDVLMYLTPNFCMDVLECVTDQIIAIHGIFLKSNPGFVSNGGKCSLMGHSLGSVICWDLLAVLHDHQVLKSSNPNLAGEESFVQISKDGHAADVGYQNYARSMDADTAKNGSFGPSLPRPMKRVLPFEPHHTIFLGSPIGLFLTLRGAHPVFDMLRDKLPDGPGKPKASPFRLPSGSIHNVFHPSDPVAYRIEPLLLAQGTEDLPPPLYLTREGEDVRLHVKARQLGEQVRKSIVDNQLKLSSFMSTVSSQAQSMLQQLDDRNSKTLAQQESDKDKETTPLRFPLAGKTGRLDYQLQPNVIDSEYVSAVLAHSSYFGNTDVIDYTIDLTSTKFNDTTTAMVSQQDVSSQDATMGETPMIL